MAPTCRQKHVGTWSSAWTPSDNITGRSSQFRAHPGFADGPNLIADSNIIPAAISR
jgi:hypothetical protein